MKLMTKNYIVLFKVLLFFIVYCILILGLQLLFYLLIREINVKYFEYSIPLSFICILPIVYLMYTKSMEHINVMKNYKRLWLIVFISVGYYFISWLIFSRQIAVNKLSVELFHEIYLIITFLILSPIIEELFFRGIILRIIAEKNNKTIAVFFSSILFTLIHVFYFDGINLSLIRLIDCFLFSIIISLIYIKTQNIYYAIIFHGVYNLCWYMGRYLFI